MNWNDVVTVEAFCRWAAKTGAGAQVRQGRRLDPFGTSMRHLGQPDVSHLLGLVEAGESLPGRGGAGNQDEIDLRTMGLIENPAGVPVLTALGRGVLRGWREHGLSDDSFDHELARQVILVAEALRFRSPNYMQMLEFWREVRDSYDVAELLKSPESLYLLSYLNQSVDGYNPWTVIASSHAKLVADFEAEWKKIEVATAPCAPDARAGLGAIKERIVGFATRGDPRVLFCAAMELVLRASLGEDCGAPLKTWVLPRG